MEERTYRNQLRALQVGFGVLVLYGIATSVLLVVGESEGALTMAAVGVAITAVCISLSQASAANRAELQRVRSELVTVALLESIDARLAVIAATTDGEAEPPVRPSGGGELEPERPPTG